MSSALGVDHVCVALGLVLTGIAMWLGSGEIEVAGILFAALAAFGAWLDGEDP